MVRFDRILEVIEAEDLVGNARTVGAHLLRKLDELANEDGHVSNVRGRGLMCAFDLPNRELRDRVLAKAFEYGLIILGCGERSIRFRPPLVVTREEIDEGVRLIATALRDVS